MIFPVWCWCSISSGFFLFFLCLVDNTKLFALTETEPGIAHCKEKSNLLRGELPPGGYFFERKCDEIFFLSLSSVLRYFGSLLEHCSLRATCRVIIKSIYTVIYGMWR